MLNKPKLQFIFVVQMAIEPQSLTNKLTPGDADGDPGDGGGI